MQISLRCSSFSTTAVVSVNIREEVVNQAESHFRSLFLQILFTSLVPLIPTSHCVRGRVESQECRGSVANRFTLGGTEGSSD